MNIAVFKEPGVVAMLVLLGAAAAFALLSGQERGESGQSAGFHYQGQGNGGFRQGAGKPEQDASQRRARLSPDERRKLRRQIDEAGQDIYRARR